MDRDVEVEAAAVESTDEAWLKTFDVKTDLGCDPIRSFPPFHCVVIAVVVIECEQMFNQTTRAPCTAWRPSVNPIKLAQRASMRSIDGSHSFIEITFYLSLNLHSSIADLSKHTPRSRTRTFFVHREDGVIPTRSRPNALISAAPANL